MDRLIIVRHAKAAWDPDGPDHDRPLAPEGEAAARRMGAWLRSIDWVPDTVVASSARRAQDTARLLLEGAGEEREVQSRHDLYLASADDYLAVDGPGTVMLVGHEPTASATLRRLAPDLEEPEDGKWMPTCTAACFEAGRLVHWQRPKELPSA